MTVDGKKIARKSLSKWARKCRGECSHMEGTVVEQSGVAGAENGKVGERVVETWSDMQGGVRLLHGPDVKGKGRRKRFLEFGWGRSSGGVTEGIIKGRLDERLDA